ncbi:hypothetical protein BH20ACT24_BH20ACT24_15220 [soil metagenome]
MTLRPGTLVLRAIAMLALAAGASLPTTASAQAPSVEADVEYGTAAGQALLMDVYSPPGGGINPALVLIHPGGFVGGDKADAAFVRVAEFYAGQGFVVFSINYRSARENFPYPAQVEDAKQAVSFIRSNAEEFGVDPARIGTLGASAGGTIAASVGMEGEGSLGEGSRVAAVVSWSGALDLLSVARGNLDAAEGVCTYITGERCQRQFRGDPAALEGVIAELQPRLEAASPISHVDSSDPPMFIANSPSEFIPFDQAEAMATTLDEAGIANEFFTAPGGHALAYTDSVLQPSMDFLQEHLVDFRPGERPANGSGGTTPLLLMGGVVLALGVVVLAVVVARRRRAAY